MKVVDIVLKPLLVVLKLILGIPFLLESGLYWSNRCTSTIFCFGEWSTLENNNGGLDHFVKRSLFVHFLPQQFNEERTFHL